MKPEDHPARYDHLATGILIARNSKPHEWAGFHKTIHEIRTLPTRDEFARRPTRPI